ncbi:AAA family ATPase [Actinocrispum sp. NPDC049592]|uniref:helix-turn-helix transcriptional regulator n=1 Tax=Actinocrispum sp. NPDC049592 TaxID=3154835 RepID=UPI003440C32F
MRDRTDPPALVGRHQPLDALAKALHRAADGRFQLADLVGEPGIGKTSLLTDTVTRARDQGMLVLDGRAAEFAKDVPLGLITDALRPHLRPKVVARLQPAEIGLLGTVFPTLATDRTAGAPRYRLYQAVSALIEALADPSGLLLALDDVHWADESSLELLDYLVRHPPPGPMLVVLAYRPAQAPPRLTTALAQAAPGVRQQIPLEPLSPNEIDAFLGPEVNLPRRQWLAKVSGGNPFHLQALARLDSAPALPGGLPDDFLTDIPLEVRAALRVELSRLSDEVSLVARSAAVIGDEFDPVIVAAAAQISEDEALTALDSLTALDIMRESHGRFRFRHPLVRHAAYAAAAPGWRLAAHHRIADLLTRLHAPPTRIAHHVARSARFGDRDAVSLLAEAASTVAVQAPATAAYWLQSALRLLPAAPEDAATRADLLTDLVLAQSMSGQLEAGRDTALEALRLLPITDHARRVRVAPALAVLERLLGNSGAARTLLLSELREMPDSMAFEAVPLHLRLVVEEVWHGWFDVARHMLTEVSEAHQGKNHGVDVAVAALRPMPDFAAGDVSAALEHIGAADRLLATATNDDLAPWMDAVSWLGSAELMVGQITAALHTTSRAVKVARTTSQHFHVAPLLCTQARALGHLGDLAKGIACAEEAVEISLLLRTDQWTATALAIQSVLLTWSGDHQTALQLATRAEQAKGKTRGWYATLAQCARGLALAANGDRHAEASAAIAAACESLQSVAPDSIVLLLCCDVMAELETRHRNHDAATMWAERAERAARPELAGEGALAQLVRARTLEAGDKAVDLARDAAEVLTETGLRLDAARAWLCAGSALADAGERRTALSALKTSAELFESYGARGLLAQANRLRRRLGVRIPGPRTARGQLPFGLSPREMEIARYVIQGHTNQKIAELLFVSVRTVETHLSHIFHKLGVTGRVSIGRVLGPELERADDP